MKKNSLSCVFALDILKQTLLITATRRCRDNAGVAKLVDAPDLGSGAARRGGSSPSTRTTYPKKIDRQIPMLGSKCLLSEWSVICCATVAMVGLKDEAHCIICAAHKFGEHDYDLKFNVMHQTNCS